MKKIFLLLSIFICSMYPQKFSQLTGIDDAQNNTHLFYRIYENKGGFNYDSIYNNIYHIDIANNVDTLFLKDYNLKSNSIPTNNFQTIRDFAFIDNSPAKFVYTGEVSGNDNSGFVKVFDRPVLTFPNTMTYNVEVKDNITFYLGADDKLRKTTNGGTSWVDLFATPLTSFNLITYKNNKLYYADNDRLKSTGDEGATFTILDEISGTKNQLFFDKNSNYIYRLTSVNDSAHRFYVSNQGGNPFSWTLVSEYTGEAPYISLDKNNEGVVYIASGTLILKSTNYCSSLVPFKYMDKRIKGMYVKPGGSKIYVACIDKIVLLENNNEQVIKSLPANKKVLSFQPLKVGMKWVYKFEVWNNKSEYYQYYASREILKDTMLANNKIYKMIRQERFSIYDALVFERLDSLTGVVYQFEDGVEKPLEELNVEVKDSLYGRFFHDGKMKFDWEEKQQMFGRELSVRQYFGNFLTGATYNLTEDIGITYISFGYDFGHTWGSLKGYIKDGIIYGDTTFVGVENEKLELPVAYSLQQNYPNPFNPATSIKFTIPASGKVKLVVYDILGKEIATLVDEFRNAGSYTEQFNASNLSSGTYFYKISCNDFSSVKKMTFVK